MIDHMRGDATTTATTRALEIVHSGDTPYGISLRADECSTLDLKSFRPCSL